MVERKSTVNIRPGQLWVWRDKLSPLTRRHFVVLTIRPCVVQSSLENEWETVVVYDTAVSRALPCVGNNYWPDGEHWELLSDA